MDAIAKLVKLQTDLSNDIVTEDSAALQFVENHGHELRYCHDTGAWFRWNGSIWTRDRTHTAFSWARDLARELVENGDKKARFIASKVSFASGVEKFCQRDQRIAVTADNWDRDLMLLGTPRGTVDLVTGTLQPSKASDGITKATWVVPDEGGHCPRWRQFLVETTGGDEDLIRFLKQWCGYCLTGLTSEHALAFVYGPGKNGKSVFLNTVSRIMHDYATTSAIDTFTQSYGTRHTTDLAMLRGARLVTASETEDGGIWAESRIKQLTGGDLITARFMRQDNFTFAPQFKLTIVGNFKPTLRNIDGATRRRFNIIPFTHVPPSPDSELEDIDEAPGILRWMINGCLDWQANRLVQPLVVASATEEYFEDQDLLGQWLGECCEVRIGHRGHYDLSGDLYANWKQYAETAGEKSGTQKALVQGLAKRGFPRDRLPGGARIIRFVRLKPSEL
jgi:putative DNA primase/helicase